MRSIVIFFSQSGRTASVAQSIASVTQSDLFEIRPQIPYTDADVKWKNPLARCNREMVGKKDVSFIGQVAGWEQYDRVLIGFPIWYGGAPKVVSTFAKSMDWTGKRVAIFATSGGTGIEKGAEKLMDQLKGAGFADAKLVHSEADAIGWAQNVDWM